MKTTSVLELWGYRSMKFTWPKPDTVQFYPNHGSPLWASKNSSPGGGKVIINGNAFLLPAIQIKDFKCGSFQTEHTVNEMDFVLYASVGCNCFE